MAKARTLRTVIPTGSLSISTETLTLLGNVSSWEQHTNGGFTFLTYRTYFDLSGYSKQRLTTFPQSVLFQDMGNISGTNGGTVPIRDISLVTTEPVTQDDLFINASLQVNKPGMSTSNFDLSQIIAGRTRAWEQLSTTGSVTLTGQTSWGAGDATSADKLYITQCIVLVSTVDCSVTFPEIAVVMPSIIDEEPDLEYIYRQYQSYETQPQV
jgi:hypothetical protein